MSNQLHTTFRGHDLAPLGQQLGTILTDIFRGKRIFPEGPAAVPSIPDVGCGLEGIADLWRLIERQSAHLSSPRMLGHMDVAPHPVAALTHALTSALSNNLLFRELSPFASDVEEQLIALFIDKLGMGRGAGGTFVSGGSLANLSALFAAVGGFESITPRDRFHICCPASAHVSIGKSAAVLGVHAQNIQKIACDAGGRMQVEALQAAIDHLPSQAQPIVVCVAGSTIHGSIDPIPDIAAVAASRGAWLHVDAIYGAALMFSDLGRGLLQSVALADSVALGPQKWMYVPRLSAALIFKSRELFERRLGTALPYSFTALPHRGQWGLQGSRPADAVILWAVLQTVGTRTVGEIVDNGIGMTKRFHKMLQEVDGIVQTHVPDLNIQAFKLVGADADGQKTMRVHQELTRSNTAWFSISKWADDVLFRAVLLPPMITEDDLGQALHALQTSMVNAGV